MRRCGVGVEHGTGVCDESWGELLVEEMGQWGEGGFWEYGRSEKNVMYAVIGIGFRFEGSIDRPVLAPAL